MYQFQPILIPEGTDPVSALRIMRLNSLGSLHYFLKVALKRRRLTDHFHLQACHTLESDRLKMLIEWPRDHFKSTIAGEGLPMWSVLPVSDRDIDMFLKFGFPDEFIRWILRKHDCTRRNLLVSENITNASKLGSKIRRHYESNDIYRTLFPETLPTSSERWTDFSLQVRQPDGSSPHGEGTFDFIGVGGATQSRHYNGFILQDDLVGRKAIESPSVMEKTIDYHVLVSALYDSPDPNHEGDEIVIGNRWGYRDLNSHIREHEPWFLPVDTHSALGGCCAAHPQDTPIFPEEWSVGKLQQIKQKMGSYRFSCQYQNNPCAPEDSDFKEQDLNWFSFHKNSDDGSLIIQHEVKGGIIRKDLPYRRLNVAMACDPTHTATGRCRHAIVVLGMCPDNNYYLLDTWAEACSHEKFFAKIYEIAKKWHVRRVGFETCAGQSLALPHIKYLNTVKDWHIEITPLKVEVEDEDGNLTTKKEFRIRNILGPIIEFGRFFMQRKHMDFLAELQTFPKGMYCDQLDAAAYIPQILRSPKDARTDERYLKLNREQTRQIAQPFTAGRVGIQNMYYGRFIR